MPNLIVAIHSHATKTNPASSKTMTTESTVWSHFESPLYSKDLTWTVAQSYMEYPENSTITTVKDYYLGTPPDLDLTSEQQLGCALFFVDSNATFPTPPSTTNPYARPPGQCPSVLGSECVKALRSRAADAATNNRPDSLDDLCEQMRQEFESSVPSECSYITNSTEWGRIDAGRMYDLSITKCHTR